MAQAQILMGFRSLNSDMTHYDLSSTITDAGLPGRSVRDAFADSTTGIPVVAYSADGWEYLTCTLQYGSPDKLLRSASNVIASSAGGGLVAWPSGSRNVIITDLHLSTRLNLSDLGNADTALTNLGATTTGANLVKALDAAAARSTLGLGDAALRTIGTSSGTQVPDRAGADARYLLSGTSRIEAPVGTVLLFGAEPLPSNVTRQNASSDIGLFIAKSGQTAGTAGSGTSWDNSGGISVGGTALTISHLPAHSHEYLIGTSLVSAGGNANVNSVTGASGTASTSVGGGLAHNHPLSSTSAWRWPHERWVKGSVSS